VNSFVQFSANPVVQGLYTDSTPVKIYGFEGEASYALGRNTSLSGSMTLLHSEYVNFVTGSQRLVGNPVDFTGLPLDLAPELTLTGAFEHAFELGGNTKLKFRVATKYSSAYYLSSSQDGIRYRQPGYTRSDASLTYDVDGGRYFIQAFVENIENKIQRTSWGATGYAAGVNGTDGVYGGVGSSHAPSARPDYWMAFYTTSPRLYGLRLGAKF
jgi:iron complex outermembrane receptor protein